MWLLRPCHNLATSITFIIPANLAAISGPVPCSISFRCVYGRLRVDVQQHCHGESRNWCDYGLSGRIVAFEVFDPGEAFAYGCFWSYKGRVVLSTGTCLAYFDVEEAHFLPQYLAIQGLECFW